MRCNVAPLAFAVLCSSFSCAVAETHAAAGVGGVAETHAADAAAGVGEVGSVQAPPTRLAMSLQSATRLALAHNPELAIARLELQAWEGTAQQAGARPNPELGLLVEDTRSASRTTTIQWRQSIELGGKRAARVSAAAHGREQAGISLLAKQAELRAAVALAFFELLGAQEQVRLTQASLDLAGKASSIAGKRVQAGKVPPLEQTQALVAESGVRAELAQAQSDLRLGRQRLSAFWGPGQAVFDRVDGDAARLPDLPSDRLVGELMAQAPAIRLARLDIARRQALSQGERAKRVPDLTVTLGAKRDSALGHTQAIVGLSMPLPLLDRNQGDLVAALRREDQAREMLKLTRLRLQSEVSGSLETLGLMRQQVQVLRAEVLPAAQTAYAVAVKGYALGKFAFLDVLDAQRTLFQLRQKMLRNTADAYRAAAELDRMLGPSPDRDDAQTTRSPE
jgi:cobalt-zinc-cadmium efflux system outer membrane protein